MLKNQSFNDLFFKASVYTFVVTLPISLLANNIATIALVLSHIIYRVKTKTHLNKFDILLFIPVAAYVLEIVALLYTKNLSDGYFELEKKLVLLLFPLIALYDNRFKSKLNMSTVMDVFSIAILFVCIYCQSVAIIDILQKDLPSKEFLDYEYSGHELLKPFSLHATYVGIYLLLVLHHLYKRLLSGSKFYIKLLFAFTLLYTIFCIFHTSSRVAFIGLLVLMGIVFYQNLKQFSLMVRIVIPILLLSVFTALAYYYLPYLAYKFLWIKELIFLPKAEDVNKLEYLRNERVYLWPTAMELIAQKPILGYGPGDVFDDLVNIYQAKGYTVWAEGRYNVHSQYLHTWISTGILGLGLLLAMIMSGIVRGIQKSSYLFVLSILTALVCVTEVFFGLHQGIAFFGFFYVLFVKNATV
jgi:O-antigen ligase